MIIELKNVKHSEFASEETNCFSATIYIDGKKAGGVSNAGCGGADRFESHDTQRKLDAYAATLPKITFGTMQLSQSAETLIGDLLTAYLTKRDLKRMCATKVCFKKPNEVYNEGEYSTLKAKFSPEAKAFLVKKYGADVFILNETI